ncbi:MAG: PAS domain-containing protein [Nitrospira sp.]
MPDKNLEHIEARIAIAAEFLRKQREYLKRLDLALTIAGVGMWDWEMSSDTLTWDGRMCELFDEPVEGIKTYNTFFDKIVPQDREMVQEAINNALAGATYDVRYCIELSDGSRRRIHARGLLHKNGGPPTLIGVCLEINDEGHACVVE